MMINKPINLTAASQDEVPRVGGEDDSRACTTDFRVGGEDDSRSSDANVRVGGEDDSRAFVTGQPGASLAEQD